MYSEPGSEPEPSDIEVTKARPTHLDNKRQPFIQQNIAFERNASWSHTNRLWFQIGFKRKMFVKDHCFVCTTGKPEEAVHTCHHSNVVGRQWDLTPDLHFLFPSTEMQSHNGAKYLILFQCPNSCCLNTSLKATSQQLPLTVIIQTSNKVLHQVTGIL